MTLVVMMQKDVVINVRVPRAVVVAIDDCVKGGLFMSRSEFCRNALRGAIEECSEAAKS